jgi:hypothetical protein
LLLSPAVQPAFAGDCQTGRLGELVRQGKDLYLGELHGSVEAPALVRCLVEEAVAHKARKLIVSLEQQPLARDPTGDAWRATDGRGSQAMWELTQYLIGEEKAGHLQLHQQVPGPLTFRDGEPPPKYDPVAYEKDMGEPLKVLAAYGQLIALSGNAHSRNKPLPGLAYQPAGAFVGPGVVHVAVMATSGGTAWNCIAGKCEAHPLPALGEQAGAPGSLTDGAWLDHDFIFWVPQSTASPPKLPPRFLRSVEGVGPRPGR